MTLALDESFLAALHSSKPVKGLTHGFYLYPARFPPEIARSVISNFSRPGDAVLDPFMGGGTSIVEGLAQGRRMLGVDVNALAHFVTSVRTTPLSSADKTMLLEWATEISSAIKDDASWITRPGIKNLPPTVETFVAGMLEMSDLLPFPRQRAFARCALLRLSQWSLDCKDFPAPRRAKLARQFPVLVESMFAGLRDFVATCNDAGIAKHHVTSRRLLVHQSAAKIDETLLEEFGDRPRLVFTSPPYAGVHGGRFLRVRGTSPLARRAPGRGPSHVAADNHRAMVVRPVADRSGDRRREGTRRRRSTVRDRRSLQRRQRGRHRHNRLRGARPAVPDRRHLG